MFGKLLAGILAWALILAFGAAEVHAADLNLVGTWKATWAKITPSGCTNEAVTLRILRQSGNLIGGDMSIAGYTINYVGKVPGYFQCWQTVGSSKLEVNLNFIYDITKPNQISLSIDFMDLDGDDTLMNTRYDTSAPLLRQ